VSTGPNTISYNLGQLVGASVQNGAPGQTSFFIARVQFVLLDDSDLPKFNSLGGWKAIGTIECVPFINFNDPNTNPIIARPLRSNYTQYPLVNEAVLVKVLISKEAQDNLGNYKPEFYYSDIISVWNAPEHNAVPDKSYFVLNPNDKKGTGKFISTGETKRLIKAPGDVTLEGRRGGSIRIGSNTPGFRTPWTAATSKPVLVLSNNPFNTDSPARFEDINKDGSIIMMMSGHNPGFVPASANFDSYNTLVTITEKQNVVVVDQKPQAEPTASLVQQDAKPIPADVPATGSAPVSNPVPIPESTDKKLDEEELPEREDLEQITVIVDDVPISVGTAGTTTVNISQGQNNVNSKTSTTYLKNTRSQAGSMKERISAYTRKMSGTGFVEKLSAVCKKYAINPSDMLIVMAYESGGAFPKGELRDQNGKVIAAGLIQFTDSRNYSVFKNIKSQQQFSALNTLSDVLDVPAILIKGQQSKYTFDQLDLLDFYLSQNKSVIANPLNGKVDRYGVYGVVFFPNIVQQGTITRGLDYVLGSDNRNKNYQYLVGQWNQSINDGYPITVKAFKNFVDSLFK
jgi:hypothetical protein